MSKDYMKELMTERGENRFETLMPQVRDVMGSNFNKLNVKNNDKTYNSMTAFVKYVAEFKTENMVKNAGIGHICGFVKTMKAQGVANSTLKGYLSGIRNFFSIQKDMSIKSRMLIPSDEKMGIEKRVHGNVERAWSSQEISTAKALTLGMGRKDVYHAISIAEAFGCRIDGVVTLPIEAINIALKTGTLTVTEKGKKIRNIEAKDKEQKEVLINAKAWALSEGREKGVFVDNITAQAAKQKSAIQAWIYNHRGKFQEDRRMNSWEAREQFKLTKVVEKANLTMHGLRHTYTQKEYQKIVDEYINKGFTEKEANKKADLKVGRELGHERKHTTKVYRAVAGK